MAPTRRDSVVPSAGIAAAAGLLPACNQAAAIHPEPAPTVTTPEPPSAFRHLFATGGQELLLIAAAIKDDVDGRVFERRLVDRKTWAEIAEENGETIPETCRRFRKVFDVMRRELSGDDYLTA